jgi:antitoxin MazE
MQVSKWGNSLAIRIPSVVVEALRLKEGDEVEVTVTGLRQFSVDRDRKREKALETLRRLARPFPRGWQFDRGEANERRTDEDGGGIQNKRRIEDGPLRSGRSRTRRRVG